MEENIFNSTEEILEDLKAGKIVVILDDEDRENEGDVMVAAEFATTENVNFMAKYARGLICMPMDESYAERLDLPQMCPVNTDNHLTAFSVSVLFSVLSPVPLKLEKALYPAPYAAESFVFFPSCRYILR